MSSAVNKIPEASPSGPSSPPASVPVSPEAWWVFVAVAVGTFMSALDGSVVNVVLPSMRNALHASVASIQWVVVIYLLVVSGTLLMFGRLGDLRGYKRTYLIGFMLFVAGSTLCGFAPSEGVLIASRGFQALGAAMLFASSPAILTSSFPPQRRGQVLGMQATFTYLGLTVGSPLGGFLGERFGWPSIFFINIPIGLLAIFLSMRFIASDKGRREGERFDFAGGVTFLVGLVALLFGLNRGADWGWTSPAVLGLLAAAVALLAVFIAIERRVSSPMLDLSLFLDRVFTSSAAAALLQYVAIYTVVFLMPFYLTAARGLGSSQAGLLIMVQSLVMAVTAPLSGWLSDKIGTRSLVIGGMAVLALGLVGLGLLGASTPFPIVAAALAVVGFGTGVFVSPNTSALLGSAPVHRRGIASGILAEARNVGMVLGVGLAGAVFTSLLGTTQPSADSATFHALSISFFVAAFVAVAGGLIAATIRRERAGS